MTAHAYNRPSATSSPTAWSTCATPIPPMHWCASPIAMAITRRHADGVLRSGTCPVVFAPGGPMEAGRPGSRARRFSSTSSMRWWRPPMPRCLVADVQKIERRRGPDLCRSGMFTANSMNCLIEVPVVRPFGNGSLVATHADREQLFRQGRARHGRRTGAPLLRAGGSACLAAKHREQAVFENAMSLIIAMGGSTNTVLHLLAAAQGGGTGSSPE